MTLTFFLEILLMGIILSADSFSAAVAMGCRPFKKGDALKFALASGSAEALVTLVGYFTGANFLGRFNKVSNWIGFSLLVAVAIHLLLEGYEEYKNVDQVEQDCNKNKSDQLSFHSFTKVIVVSLATSLDALGVGVGLGIAHRPIIPFMFSIGIWAFISTILGLNLARHLSSKLGPIFTMISGFILILIAINIVCTT
jgi:putative Mn2+ efflux pump MntP